MLSVKQVKILNLLFSFSSSQLKQKSRKSKNKLDFLLGGTFVAAIYLNI